MVKEIFSLVLAIFLISFVSSYYAGETISVSNTLQSTDLEYAIVGNSTAVELIFKITINEINITFPANIAPDTFTIFIINNETQTIEVPVTNTVYSSSGGGGAVIYRNQTVNQTIYLNQTQPCADCEEKIITKIEKQKLSKGVVLFFIFLSLILLLFFIIKIRKTSKLKKELKEIREVLDGTTSNDTQSQEKM